MLKQKINLRMANQDAAPIVNLVQNDTGREIECNILDFDIPAGATSKLWLIKPSGKISSCDGVISGNMVTVALTDQVVAEDGMCVAQLKITKDGKTLSSFSMYFNFEEDTSTNGIISQEEIKLVESFIQEQKRKLDAYIAEKTQDIEKLKTDVGTLSNDLTTLRNDHNTDIESLEQNSAPPIILTATGESIVVEDSAERRVRDLKIFGKTTQVQTNGYQLFDASKIPSKTTGGATVTNNGDGSFTVSGSGNLTETFSAYYELSHKETIQILKVGRISVANNEANPSLFAYLYYGNYGKYYNLITDTIKYTDITDEMLSHPDCVLRCYMYGYSGKAIKPGTIKPMLYQTGDETWESYTGGKPSPSPDYPQDMVSVGMNGEIKTLVHSTQLFDASKIPSKTSGGATITNNGDGSFTVSGSGNLTNDFNAQYEVDRSLVKIGKMTLKGSKTYPYLRVKFIGEKGEIIRLHNEINTVHSIELTKEILDKITRVEISFWGNRNTAILGGTIKPMIYQDGDGTWEPYKPLQSLTIQTPNGLPGIPVTSGGNYTDSTGRQWVCDEIDLKRGVYVQRVKEIKLKAVNPVSLSPQINNNSYAVKLDNQTDMKIGNNLPGISNAFILSKNKEENSIRFGSNDNDIYLYLSEKYKGMTADNLQNELNKIDARALYIIATPVETPLAEEILQAFKSLRTYYPDTVVTNDADTGMELEYIADTQKYIDNKFAEMNKAVVATQKALL